ncbi:TRAP transporter substrate-binding protein [Chloroflexota bacterium]
MTHGYPEDGVRGQSATKFADLVAEYTDGKITVDVHPLGTLFSASASFTATVTDSVDIYWDPPYFVAAAGVPWVNLVYLGGLWAGVEHATRVFQNEMWIEKTKVDVEAKGVHVLGWVHESMNTTYPSNWAETTDIRDFDGAKFGLRTGASPVPMSFLAGFAQVSVPQAEMFTALQQGVIDVMATGLTTCVGRSLWELVPYCHVQPIGPVSTLACMSQNTWDSLPTEYQDLMSDVIMPEIFDFAEDLLVEMEADLIATVFENFEYAYMDTPAQMAEYWIAMQEFPITQGWMQMAPAELFQMIEDMK